MSDRDGVPEIPEGRRLVRMGGDRGLSLGERLSAQFYRLSWRSPLHSLRLRGRYPLKLLAVPRDPLPGNAARGVALIESRAAFADLPPDAHRFGFLRDLAAVDHQMRTAPLAERLMQDWLAAHGDAVAEPAWRADHCGWRILNWAAYAPLILSSGDIVYRSSVLNTLARTARHLDRTADRAPTGNARIAAWAGIVAAGLLIPGGEPRRAFGEAGLARAFISGFSEDGGVVSRSPRDQIEGIELIAMLAAAYDARNEELPEFIVSLRTRVVAALLGIVMGDGALSSWQGMGPLSAAAVRRVVEASGVRTRPLRHARDWGYQRLAAGGSVVIVDAAPPPPSRIAAIGCASTLAFELSDGEHRIIVNCGGSERLPADLVQGLRTTAAHSTLALDDRNSTAIHDDGSLGAGVGSVELERTESEGGSQIDVTHDGYAKRLGFLHKRTLALSANGAELRGEDSLLPAPRRRKTTHASFAVRFHLAPEVEVTPTADGQGMLLRIDHETLWQFRCRGGTLTVEESLWIDTHGRPRATSQFVIAGTAAAGGANISWLLKRAK